MTANAKTANAKPEMTVWEVAGRFGLDELRLAPRPAPQPGPGEAVVGVRAVSLNYRDLLMIQGQYNPRLRFPFVPCSDAAGVVSSVGPGVTNVAPGDRVAACFMPLWQEGPLDDSKAKSALGAGGPGALAEQLLLPAAGLVKIPANLTDEEAATLPCAGVTAWNALFGLGRTDPGDTVLVQGTGGVSVFAAQFARLAGARVIAVSRSAEKLARLADLGVADRVLSSDTPQWEEAARSLTGGRGVDHVIDVGGAGTLDQSLKAVRKGGRISVIGVLGGTAAPLNLLPVLMNQITLQGVFVGSKAVFESLLRGLAAQPLRPVIDRTFEFGQAREALAHLASGSHWGKVCIRVTSGG